MINVTPQLIEKYHLGQCTAAEREAVERWLADEDMEVFEPPQLRRDGDELTRLWTDMESRLPVEGGHAAGNLSHPAKRRLLPAVLLSGAAAMVAMILFLWPVGNDEAVPAAVPLSVLDVPQGRKAQLTLNDGTLVHLNGGSRLEYPEVFGEGRRLVKLMGEGFFAVAHDADRPFVVDAGNTTTEVLGTAFNLAAYPDESHTLLVEVGKVRFEVKGSDKTRIVNAGQGARWAKPGALVPIAEIPRDRFAWKEGKLVFNNHRLAEIAVRLQRWYGVSVTIERPDLKTMTFTGSFARAPLKTVMDDLAFVMQFHYRLSEKEVVIF